MLDASNIRNGDSTSPRLLICGSMSAYSEMLYSQTILDRHGIAVEVPTPDTEHTSKKDVSLQYLQRILDAETWGILVLNTRKHGIEHYIGPNTFAEIAVAFSAQKPIYLMYGVPKIYEDELEAWEVVPLYGDIDILARRLSPSLLRDDSSEVASSYRSSASTVS